MVEQVVEQQRKGASSQLPGLIGLLARLILGVVLLVAGGLKVTSPEASALAVRAFQILPYDFAGYVGYALPVVERLSALAGGVLMVVYMVGIASAWMRGLNIDCGCFGGGGTIGASETLYVPDLLRDAGLAACAVWLVVRAHTAYSFDHRLFI